MKLKTFRGSTMAEALEQVKRQFGRDAVILNTRTLTRGGFLGMGGAPYVEITAVRDVSHLPKPVSRATTPLKAEYKSRADGAANMSAPPTTHSPPQFDTILSEVGALKGIVADLVHESRHSRTRDVPAALFDTYQMLVANAVAEQLAEEVIGKIVEEVGSENLGDESRVERAMAVVMEKMVPTAGPIRIATKRSGPTTIALVGPTGVGKTTTVAKLAAEFCLRQHLKVGLITIDTYRIAAVEQLRTYAQIIDVPLEVASSPKQYAEAINRLSDRDVILVDSSGRSQRDVTKIKDLEVFFKAHRPDEVHLVLSSTAGESVLQETIERFNRVKVNRVIFTKLDEAIGYGVILSCLQKTRAKLSYITTGQDVPDDIEIGQSARLAELLMGKPAFGQQVAERVG